jgi:cytoskeletal protein RodZ
MQRPTGAPRAAARAVTLPNRNNDVLPKSRWVTVVLLLLALGVTALLIWLFALRDTSKPPKPETAPQLGSAEKAPPDASREAPPPAPDTPRETAAAPPAAEVTQKKEEPAVADEPPPAVDAPPSEEASPPAERAEPPRKKPTRAADNPKLVNGPVGYLTLTSDLWAYVSIDRKGRIITPVVKRTLAAGRHDIVLFNPDNRVRRKLTVDIRPGEVTTAHVRWVEDAPPPAP